LNPNPTYPCIVINDMDIQHAERQTQSETAAARAEPARRSPTNSLTAPTSKLTICAGLDSYEKMTSQSQPTSATLTNYDEKALAGDRPACATLG
jgi:hypothetical protein